MNRLEMSIQLCLTDHGATKLADFASRTFLQMIFIDSYVLTFKTVRTLSFITDHVSLQWA